MKTLRLAFRRDSRTGLPRLQARRGRLQPAEQIGLEAEIRRRFERLVEAGSGAVVTLDTPIERLPPPHRFRLTLDARQSHRCPDLLLESVDCLMAAPAVPARMHQEPPPHWSAGFIAELDALLSPAELSRLPAAQRATLLRARDELRRICADAPSELAARLMAGQVLLHTVNGRGRGPIVDCISTLAGRPASERSPANRPVPVPAVHSAGKPHSTQVQRTLRILARVFDSTSG